VGKLVSSRESEAICNRALEEETSRTAACARAFDFRSDFSSILPELRETSFHASDLCHIEIES
jgi:hypothetical protein